MTHRLLALILFACSSAPTLALALTPPPQPRLMQSGAEQPIALHTLRISSEISGGMAETTVHMVFANKNARTLEGELQFPLLDGQQISALALDINGQLRPAVTVPKAKGRQIFEAIVRRGVDPALLEQTQGNNFKLRVYPFFPMASRTVEFKYTEALARAGDNWRYRLPLVYGERIEHFELRLTVNGATSAPIAAGALGALAFKRAGGRYQAGLTRTKFTPDGMLTLAIPAAVQAQTFVQQHAGETYFVTEIPVPSTRARRKLPKTVGLLWDSSGSGAARSHAAELHELGRYFAALGNAEVRLTRLRDRAEPSATYRIVNGDWSALRGALENTVYDGASALADWKAQSDVGEYLLVSDGLLNYGNARFPVLSAQQRLYALNASVAADTARLGALAERSGGRLVQVDPQHPGAAAEALLSEGVQLRQVSAHGAGDILVESLDPQHGLLRIAGKLLKPDARLTLSLVQDGATQQRVIELSGDKRPHPTAAQLWASYKLRTLEADFEANRAAILALGTRFGIPTRETSLIVLEMIEDYVRYDLAPPPEFMQEYERISKSHGAQLRLEREAKLERVVQGFAQKTAWWRKRYPEKPTELQRVNITATKISVRHLEVSSPVPMVVMSPGPIPAPPAEAAPGPASAAPAQPGPASRARTPQVASGMGLQAWVEDAPYIARMNAAPASGLYQVYLEERPAHLNSPTFYVDVADLMFKKGQRYLALRVLSNLAEMDLENRHVLRVLGHRLMQAGEPQLAIAVFAKVRDLAEEEPQSFRDLGLAHGAAGQHQQAIDALYETVLRPWDARFGPIELIALTEMNAIIASAPGKLDTGRIDRRLLVNTPLDLHAVLTWDADNSDMNLQVTDPDGEVSRHFSVTTQGGRMSPDIGGGYGPEEFALRRAKPGKYKVEASFAHSRQQVVSGAVNLQLKLTLGLGSVKAKETTHTLRLHAGNRGKVLVGEFEITARCAPQLGAVCIFVAR
ncbi:MAG: VIT domain-containing protein [Pseudomonadota bacterium]